MCSSRMGDVWLEVSLHNTDAIAFYERLGCARPAIELGTAASAASAALTPAPSSLRLSHSCPQGHYCPEGAVSPTAAASAAASATSAAAAASASAASRPPCSVKPRRTLEPEAEANGQTQDVAWMTETGLATSLHVMRLHHRRLVLAAELALERGGAVSVEWPKNHGRGGSWRTLSHV